MKVAIVALLVFLVNIPFGIWRAKQVSKSPKWFLAIHLPIPIVIFLRIYSGMGFQLYTYPILVTAFFLGQFLGGKIKNGKPAKAINK
ncbi:hypothetical protein BMS3Abin04_00953 [bacterium BMS3Abin04]|nr:hypothetical protein BMS3Abin04_00953 [bacterium BMS3Abin04]